MRVPRCELLLANSAAKGTIRAGQFSSITNVIQSGGEDGMWTFDRYQRWMEQQRDWVRPAAPPVGAGVERDVPRAAAPRVTVPAGVGGGSAAAARGPTTARPAPPAKAAPKGTPDGPEEITIDEDLDPNELEELARSIERRTP